MNSPVINQIESAIGAQQASFANDDKYQEFVEASKKFNQMVEKGLVKKRGHNLLSAEKSHLRTVGFNTSK